MEQLTLDELKQLCGEDEPVSVGPKILLELIAHTESDLAVASACREMRTEMKGTREPVVKFGIPGWVALAVTLISTAFLIYALLTTGGN